MGAGSTAVKHPGKRGRKPKALKASVGSTIDDRGDALYVSVSRRSQRAAMDYAGCGPKRGYRAPRDADAAPPPRRRPDAETRLHDRVAAHRWWEANHRLHLIVRARAFLRWAGAYEASVELLGVIAVEGFSLWVQEEEDRDREDAEAIRRGKPATDERHTRRLYEILQAYGRRADDRYESQRDHVLGVAPAGFVEAMDVLSTSGGRVTERSLPTDDDAQLAAQVDRHRRGLKTTLFKEDTKFRSRGSR
ncbi:MAG TPA: hypothetical protein VGN72_14540 [Tepidisphaeraceae bacterium]|jgi:hypothetical protein|nr:hypothetical protein [Tepidisphaeraceae bacterium]